MTYGKESPVGKCLEVTATWERLHSFPLVYTKQGLVGKCREVAATW